MRTPEISTYLHHLALLYSLPCFCRRGKAPAVDRNSHLLFLEESDAERLAEHAFQFGLRIFDLLGAGAATKIGMDHVALDRTGPDDRDLDDEIVKSARLDVRQHRHLRPALDLEGAERVGRADQDRKSTRLNSSH